MRAARRRLADRRHQLGRAHAARSGSATWRAAEEPLVTFKGRTVAADARLLAGPERDEKWAVMLETWPNYAKYAERTDRELPVFWLTPR